MLKALLVGLVVAMLAVAAQSVGAAPPVGAGGNTSQTIAIKQFLRWSNAQYGDQGDVRTAEGRLYAWAKAGTSYSGLVSKATSAFSLKPSAAADLVPLILKRGSSQSGGPSKQLANRFVSLSHAHPRSGTLLIEAARTINDRVGCDKVAPYERLLAGREDADTDRVRLYKRFYCLQLLTERTTLDPTSVAPYVALAQLAESDNPLLALAFHRVADQKAERSAAVSKTVRQKLRMLTLTAELNQGRLRSAVALLPAQDGTADDPLLRWINADTRRTLAAAFLLLGKPARAAWWRKAAISEPLGATPWTDSYYLSLPSPSAVAYENALLDRLEKPVDSGHFDFLVEYYRLFDQDSADLPWQAVWQRAYDLLAVRDGYPGFAQSPVPYGLRPSQIEATRAEAIKQCYHCAPDLIGAINRIAREPLQPEAERKAQQTDDLPAPILGQMNAEIAAPVPYWTLHQLPAPFRHPPGPPPHVFKDGSSILNMPPSTKPSSPPEWASRLPTGTLVRYERDGQRIIAITASQSLDPTGEISAGGYWVSISQDGGKHFAPPLYTGLRMFEPYVVMSESKFPMVSDGNLRLEVEVRKLDDKEITLPPIALIVKEREDNLYLSIPLSNLARDSDGDGLTDIEDWAMLLNPRNPDVNGNGVPNGRDMLPQVPTSRATSRYAAPVAAVLRQIFGTSLGAIVTTSATSRQPARAAAVGRGETDLYNNASALFVEAPAKYFEGIKIGKRVIVLNVAQIEALEQARGRFFYSSIPVLVVSHDGAQALVVWSDGWAGGTVLVKHSAGKWVVTRLSNWIS